MAERDRFERDLAAFLRTFADDAPTDVRPAELAHHVAAAHPHRRWVTGGWTIRLSPALAWILLLAGLLLAATASAIFVGGQLLRHTSELSVVPPSVTLTLEHPGEVSAVAWSPDGTRLATGSRVAGGNGFADRTRESTRVWDTITGDEVISVERLYPVDPVAFSPDGTRLAAGAVVLDAVTGEILLAGLPDRFLAYDPDGTSIVVGGAWGWVAILDAATGEERFALPLAPSWMHAAAWSPDGALIATTWGTSIKIWDASTGDERLTIDGLVNVTDVAWSQDGTRIATAHQDRFAAIWDAATGDRLLTLQGQAAVEWSPDSKRIATVGVEGSARIWDATTGRELVTLDATRVTDLAWSPDGTRVATASDDGIARVWVVAAAPGGSER